MKTLGQQLLLDIWLKPGADADIESKSIGELIRARFEVVKESSHYFSPYGITSMFILSESHAAIHTYPEHQFLSLDVYICNPAVRLDLFAQEVLAAVAVKEHNQIFLTRGHGIDAPGAILPPPSERTPHAS